MAKGIKRRIISARKRVQAEISANALGGGIAAGLSSEGRAGGFYRCLNDVLLLLDGIEPTDDNGYWDERRTGL